MKIFTTLSLVMCLGMGLGTGTGASAQSGFGSADVSSGAATDAADSFDVTGMEPDDQTPTGKFTTAAEVGMILEATKGNWVVVREYDGQDWVYFTHILSWRCGLKAAKFAINGAALEELAMPGCHMKFKQPNVFLEDESLMASRTYEPGSVETIRVDLLLDNLTVQSVTLKREDILIP